MNPYIIAEAASAHDGDSFKADRLVRLAKDAGANAVKFQFWSNPRRVAERMHSPESVAIYERYQITPYWVARLSTMAHDLGLEFICTVDCPEDIAVVAPYVDRFKIASWGATDQAFIAEHRKYGRPIIISTGTCDGQDIASVRVWRRYEPEAVTLLHCTSSYPAPIDQINLAALRAYGFDGLSDHSRNVNMGGWAVAAGARVLEVHVKLDETDPANPDYPVALNPAEFREYVRLARQAAVALGDGVKRPQPCEVPMLKHRYIQ